MIISAQIQNQRDENNIFLTTNGNAHMLSIPSRTSGYGLGVNGGELLCLALATCYCNDIYREAAKRGIQVEMVEVEVESEFGDEGEPARTISYQAKVKAFASEDEICELMKVTDRMTEIQNTVRKGLSVKLNRMEVTSLVHSSNRFISVESDSNR